MTTQQPILTVCAWCDTTLENYAAIKGNLFVQRFQGTKLSKSDQASAIIQGHSISHGICASCRDKELEQWRESQRKAENNANEN